VKVLQQYHDAWKNQFHCKTIDSSRVISNQNSRLETASLGVILYDDKTEQRAHNSKHKSTHTQTQSVRWHVTSNGYIKHETERNRGSCPAKRCNISATPWCVAQLYVYMSMHVIVITTFVGNKCPQNTNSGYSVGL